ncbi:MAG TPA: TIGR03557 family F420-dependent LLM class oxidoreductase [Thermoleophilaceae bacterium]|jgi:coenzyme F420-dependent glucose-6-phosphate dehydrogenase|nr:TIGR03557 family F420-dependent LLM class oxidoreductase [Thermoleophilaceae bacterium]
MGLVESVRSVLWARRRQPDDVVYGVGLAHERFAPDELLRQAEVAEQAGFDIIACSDHLAPWWEDGDPAPANSGNAWVWLGAASQVTKEPSIGTAVTAVIHRYNPVIVAQQIATLEILAPGRTFLGVGSGEALNEVPAGLDPFPSLHEQQERMEEAVLIIRRLLDGETVTFDGKYFKTRDAKLYSRPERRPPIYMSAFGEQAAEMAGRVADGVWTLADPRQVPGVIAGYRRGCDEAGREPGEIILQALFSWAEDDDTALESAKEWKATLPPEHYTDPIYKPAEIQENGRNVSDTTFKAGSLISSDPKDHVRRLKMIREMGATAVVVMNTSGADPEGALRVYGEEVLPEVRG